MRRIRIPQMILQNLRQMQKLRKGQQASLEKVKVRPAHHMPEIITVSNYTPTSWLPLLHEKTFLMNRKG